MTGRPRIALAAYAVVSVVHLSAQLADTETWSSVTQVLLMPVLALALVLAVGTGPRLARLTLVALGLSWLGDTVPRFLDGDPAFLALVGFFLLAQATYVLAFRPYAGAGVLGGPRVRLAPYVVAVGALMAACLPEAGVLAAPVLLYGGCLLAMAVLASGVHPLAWAGGALFLVSDGLIALQAFAPWWDLPENGVAVMTTYVLAQLLIVLGVVARVGGAGPRRSRASSGRGSSSAPAGPAGTAGPAAR